ncbi:MAG: peptidoglycan DD-metalloendopeptidase family protein [Candidatus Paceibacterota bacterium]
MKKVFISLLLFAMLFLHPFGAKSATVEELQQSIEEKSKQIETLNKEIELIDKKIQTTASTGQTLQSAIKILDTSASKLNTEVKVTESKITKTDLNIEQIGLEIGAKEQKIERNKQTIAKTLREINSSEDNSILEIVLSGTDLADMWDNVAKVERFQNSMKEQIYELTGYKTELEKKKAETEDLKKDLQSLKNQLVDKKTVIDINKKEKSTLLSQTKNEEANYRKILTEKKALADSFQNEIFNIESKIKTIIDPNSIPAVGKGVLSWPTDNVFITQYFGDTAFSRTGVYNGKGHNGIDFRAPVGTPIKAVLSGVVEEVGNTDVLPKCLSYGKWVFIRHNNGLSSVYGHLSLIKAKAGDVVKTGDIIGYAGQTGYAFGPHLHLSLFASQGVSVQPLVNSVNCKNARIPIASQNAYLNPLPYF